MKTKLTTLVIALVALFSINSAYAQSLASYTANLNGTQLSLTNVKAGGFGAKTRTMEVTLYLEVTSSVTCEKIVTLGNGRENIITNTFDKSSKDQETVSVDGKGFGLMAGPLTVEGAAAVAGCPNANSGFFPISEEGEALVRAWVIIRGYDKNGALIKESGQIEIVY